MAVLHPPSTKEATINAKTTFTAKTLAREKSVSRRTNARCYTHRSLADKLNAEKFKSVRGGKWWSRTVRVAINTVLPEV